jgi:hypothetical protein
MGGALYAYQLDEYPTTDELPTAVLSPYDIAMDRGRLAA